MLHTNTNEYKIVYPSWSRFSYGWEGLGQALRSPLESGYIDRGRDWRRLGYPETVQPFSLVNGSEGGGIICVYVPHTQKWMPNLILTKEADILKPPGEMSDIDGKNINVFYLSQNPGLLSSLLPSKAPTLARERICATSVEHLDVAGDLVYWVLGYRGGKRNVVPIDRVMGMAQAFGIDLRVLGDLEIPSSREFRDWFVDAKIKYIWFISKTKTTDIDLIYSQFVYIAYDIVGVIGSKMFSLNLIATIEGQPNSRFRWHRR